MAIGGVGKTDNQLAGIILVLVDALGQFFVPCLRLDHRQLVIAVLQHIIRDERFPALAMPLDAARRDDGFPPDAATGHHAPARRPQRGIDVLGSGLGFVHGRFSIGRVALQSG